MEQVLLVIQVIVTLAMIIMVLIQRSDSDGFGLSGGSGNNLLSGRSSANLMTRTTGILAAIFMANALLLGVIAANGRSSSIVETIQEQQADAPGVPMVPVAGETKPAKNSNEKAAPVVPEAQVKPEAQKKEAPAADAQKPARKATAASTEFDPNAAPATNE
jgi:preprotein translocase subunit SecG